MTFLCPFRTPWVLGGHVGVYWLQGRTVKRTLKMGRLAVLGQEVGTQLEAVTLPSSFPRPRKRVLVCLNILRSPGLTDNPTPSPDPGPLLAPPGMGSRPLSLALSVTNTHALLSLLVCPLSLPLLSWLLPCPLPLPGCPSLSPSSPSSPSWQSLDPAKQKQKSVSITAFCVPPPHPLG